MGVGRYQCFEQIQNLAIFQPSSNAQLTLGSTNKLVVDNDRQWPCRMQMFEAHPFCMLNSL